MTKEKGWVKFEDLTGEEHVATLNPSTSQLEYQKIDKVVNQPYSGDIINIESKTFKTSVTPNHRFLVTNQYDLNHNRPLKFKQASELTSGDLIPKKSTYLGGISQDIVINNELGEIKLPSKLFASFMGWWLSEGWLKLSNTSKGIFISQSKESNIDELDFIFKSLSHILGKKWSKRTRAKNEIEYYILDHVLVKYLSQFGLCDQKYVPQEIKNLDKEGTQLFLDAYLKGDGCIQKNQEVYYTTSPQMALDISELINLTGCMSSISEKPMAFEKYLVEGVWIKDFDWYCKKEKFQNKIIEGRKKHYTGKTLYSIRRKYSTHYHISDCTITSTPYEGNVYCVSVPNQTILVMSPNNSTFWSGNSQVINLKNVSHNIISYWWDGDKIFGQIEILPTPPGNILKTLFENNIKVGVSSRGMGSLKQIGETLEVQDDFSLLCFDFVSTPSNFGSYMTPSNKLNESLNNNPTPMFKVNRLITDILCDMGGVCKI